MENNFIIGYFGSNNFEESPIYKIYSGKGHEIAQILQNTIRHDLTIRNYPDELINNFYFNHDASIGSSNKSFFFNVSYPENIISNNMGKGLNMYLSEKVWELNQNKFCRVKTPWGISNYEVHYKSWENRQNIDDY